VKKKEKHLSIEDTLWHRPRLEDLKPESEHKDKKKTLPKKRKTKNKIINFA